MPWTPNGFAAGTDNSAAGGGGGFQAIPQTPTGLNAGFTPPENNLQAGSLSFTYVTPGLVFFKISNPGRSA